MRGCVLCAAHADTRESSSACSSFSSNSLLAYSMSLSLSSSAFLATPRLSALARGSAPLRTDPFIKRRSIQSSWPSSAVIRLHVTVPTSPTGNRGRSRPTFRAARVPPLANVCHSPVLYLDLNDVHILQTNLFGFLHHVVQGLRKKGVRHILFPLRSLTYML